jgi:CBS domain-containing protein
VLAALFASGRLLGVANPTLGPGYDTMRWALQPDHAVLVVGALAGLRLAATAATVAGGGTGGLFIPLVVEGALLGRMASGVVDPSNPTLFPVLGIAAFRGAGYRVPLASVVFVAEFTGRPGFIVPGLIAAMVAQLAMGSTSVSPYQAPARPGHLERRLALEHVVDASARTVPPDATVAELFWQHLVGGRQRAIPVVDGQRYLGMARAEDLADLDRSDWATTRVDAIARRDLPTVGLRQRVDDALHAMDAAGVDRLAVCDDGGYLGVVSVDDVIRLDDVIDRTRYGTSAAGCPASPRAASGAAREQISRSPGGSHDGPNRYTNSTRRSAREPGQGPATLAARSAGKSGRRAAPSVDAGADDPWPPASAPPGYAATASSPARSPGLFTGSCRSRPRAARCWRSPRRSPSSGPTRGGPRRTTTCGARN